MGIITLTDRISVSVRAKNETESNSQKRATGKNIANALGNGNISDALADQLGNTSKPTIADEQGREWVSMTDIIAAGKKMKENGAFEEEIWKHPDFSDVVISANMSVSEHSNSGSGFSVNATDVVYMIPYINRTASSPNLNYQYLSKKPFDVHVIQTDIYNVGNSDDQIKHANLYNQTSYPDDPIYNIICTFYPTNYYYSEDGNIYRIDKSGSNGLSCYDLLGVSFPNVNNPNPSPFTNNVTNMHKLLYDGKASKSGGSLIDWTKPDDEIEEDIRNLHETWDVSDHAGSTTANGTYVLAGPIEFNPGD